MTASGHGLAHSFAMVGYGLEHRPIQGGHSKMTDTTGTRAQVHYETPAARVARIMMARPEATTRRAYR